MASFILIHGSWHGGWCFDPVRKILEAAGHEVIAPDLPGMGGDEAQLRKATLAVWADFTAEICRNAAQQPVILAGHSRGGLVVSQAAERAAETIDALVYICAMMLPDGMSRAAFKELEGPNPAFDAIIMPVFGGAGTIVDPVAAPAVFAQLSPAPLVEAAMGRLMAEPHGPRSTALQLTEARFGSLPRTYIECTQDRTIPIASQRKMQQLVPGAAVTTLESDHSPYLCRPSELSAMLIAVANAVSR
ncbi:alpha/beta fold hydrolase [Novosphingobium sp.]|uniref:alpha/beta fold hydrolase n=1 Tax=Novosphingobium sp. TaxID=1874826 RepID=UPI0025E44231|nr:alpha/beta fold hydrolase [Novosphingobium sp.]